MEQIIAMHNVGLRRNGRQILEGIDWQVEKGTHWAVFGANGSGKTTLLQIAGGCLFPTTGKVEVLGCKFGASDLFALRKRVGWVSTALQARIAGVEKVRDIVISGLKATFGLVYEYAPEDAAKADANLALVGLADRGDAPFGVMSQGEQQRVLFARSLMAAPELLIFDEACSGLDLKARETFLGVVEDVIARDMATVVMVTHHIEEIPSGINQALVLKNGTILTQGPSNKAFTGETLSSALGLPLSVRYENSRFWASIA